MINEFLVLWLHWIVFMTNVHKMICYHYVGWLWARWSFYDSYKHGIKPWEPPYVTPRLEAVISWQAITSRKRLCYWQVSLDMLNHEHHHMWYRITWTYAVISPVGKENSYSTHMKYVKSVQRYSCLWMSSTVVLSSSNSSSDPFVCGLLNSQCYFFFLSNSNCEDSKWSGIDKKAIAAWLMQFPCFFPLLKWASYPIRKIAVCACARNYGNIIPGNIIPAIVFKGNR